MRSEVVLPGDVVNLDKNDASATQVIVGCGFDHCFNEEGDQLLVVQPGLKICANGKQWILTHSRRYIPCNGDRVLGVVTSTHGDAIKVDIGSADQAFLNFLSFEGATKSNRPNLKVGDLLFASIKFASKHLEPELTCVDDDGRARGLGVLPTSGFTFNTSLNLVRRLLSPTSKLLSLIGRDLKFEITCGLNGRIWINGQNTKEIIAIYHMIQESESVAEPDIPRFIERKMRLLQGFPVEDTVVTPMNIDP